MLQTKAVACYKDSTDTTNLSTQKEALLFLQKQGEITQSIYWPGVKPDLFLNNLKKNIEDPFSVYEGSYTNFCSYSVISSLPLHDDPLNYVRFMLQLYTEGKAKYGKEYFEPSREIKRAAGRLSFKGELDIRPADQLWFLALADHFKGYINMFDKHYNRGDENKLWAAVNYSKFNRMIRRLFNYHVRAVGSDLFRPQVGNIYEYLSRRLKTGNVALFVNNLILYKKNHAIKLDLPTHFILLLDITEAGDNIVLTYWDYGGKTRQLLKPAFLRKIIFGVSHITKKTGHAK